MTLELEQPITRPTPSLRMSEDEYVAWSGEDTRAEWVAGEVVFKMSIHELHDMLQRAIAASAEHLVLTRSLGQVRGPEFSMRLPQKPSRREPDVIIVTTANLGRLTPTLLNGPADVVVEVVSAESVARDYRVKFAEYEAGGVPEYFIVDPLARAIEGHRLGPDGRYAPIVADDRRRLNSTAVPGWWLSASELFGEKTPSAFDLARSLGVL
jgi:Uma2 family endonuclease